MDVYPQRRCQRKNGHFYTQTATNRGTVNTVYDHHYRSIQCDRVFRKRVIVIKTVQVKLWFGNILFRMVWNKLSNGHIVVIFYLIYRCTTVQCMIISVRPNF
jgi:hypothetical protein